jgi:serine/threonine protein kinase
MQPAILLCLLDIARGLEYLHSCSIVHGDLKPQNVLLKTAGTDRRGYVCKLGDFGLSRMLQETETHVNTGSYGTVTHAAPELLSEGRLTKSSDVFAFGMLLWELVTGDRLFPDMHTTQVGRTFSTSALQAPTACLQVAELRQLFMHFSWSPSRLGFNQRACTSTVLAWHASVPCRSLWK